MFEAHSPYSAQPSLQPTHPTQFYAHHHLKVPPNDITPATVTEGTTFHELTAIFLPCKIWQEVTAPKNRKDNPKQEQASPPTGCN